MNLKKSMITNPKISFNRYPGFSLLFDNPGENHFLNAWEDGKLRKLNTAIETGSELRFYRRLRDGLAEIGLLTNDNPYLCFVLPPPTCHVTVWDGLNEGNKGFVVSAYHIQFSRISLYGFTDMVSFFRIG